MEKNSKRCFYKNIFLFGKALLALNVGILLRLLLRRDFDDCINRLRDIYKFSNPFGSRDIDRLLKLYCSGQGIEIAPGLRPYCHPTNTLFVDKTVMLAKGIKIQKIENAWALPFADHRFDFLFSSHCLEHCPDTIRTLLEWRRVVRTGGYLVLILPHALRTGDCGRALTDLAHHVEDYGKKVGLDDQTHWDEFERFAVKKPDSAYWLNFPEAYLPDGSLNRQWLSEHGMIHYHVWTASEMCELLKYIGCRILFVRDELDQRADSFAVVAEVV